jgi:hypothetical protein
MSPLRDALRWMVGEALVPSRAFAAGRPRGSPRGSPQLQGERDQAAPERATPGISRGDSVKLAVTFKDGARRS